MYWLLCKGLTITKIQIYAKRICRGQGAEGTTENARMDIFKKHMNKRQTVLLEVSSSVWDFSFIFLEGTK